MFASDSLSGRLRSAAKGTWAGLTIFSLTLALGATLYQSQWWRFAVESGRLVVDYVAESEVTAAPCVHIANLPTATFEGPHVLKTYNLRHHLAARGLPVPSFRSDQVVISRFDGLVSIPQPEGFSDTCEGSEEFPLTLPLDQLRP